MSHGSVGGGGRKGCRLGAPGPLRWCVFLFVERERGRDRETERETQLSPQPSEECQGPCKDHGRGPSCRRLGSATPPYPFLEGSLAPVHTRAHTHPPAQAGSPPSRGQFRAVKPQPPSCDAEFKLCLGAEHFPSSKGNQRE